MERKRGRGFGSWPGKQMPGGCATQVTCETLPPDSTYRLSLNLGFRSRIRTSSLGEARNSVLGLGEGGGGAAAATAPAAGEYCFLL